MCGIAGYIDLKKEISKSVIQRMNDTLAHRGPDGEGIYISADNKITLAHRRLSFLDLSVSGKQPMTNHSRNVWISFNGEIYNYLELKKELAEYPFKTNTDTEVIIAGYERWGIEVVNRLKGMFAFAILDEQKQKLFLVRDRFGIKPLYYFLQNDKLIFASELKAVIASGEVKKEMDISAFTDYFVYRYIPSPKTIWKNVKKLPPAHYAEIDTSDLKILLKEYWELGAKNATVSEREMINHTNEALENSVMQHIRADVPVGSFLSGGYDSSALVHYMNLLGEKPQTFSIGFSNWQNSEHHFARIVAEHLDVPNEAVIADEKSLDLTDIMPDVYDEPIADISIVPTFMVSRLARKKVKAVLSGEGADELFGGYTWQHDFFEKHYPDSFMRKIKQHFKKTDIVAFYAQAMAMGQFDRDELLKMLTPELHSYISDDVHWFYRKNLRLDLSPLKAVQHLDVKCFMGELVLTKIDRASMANSLEVRVPFLDHELFEYFFGLNEKQYFKKRQTKFALYENIKNYLPDEILQRKKQGFVGPDSYYMNLDWYKTQLKNSKLVEHEIISRNYVDDLLKETYNWKLWKLLVMEKWFRKWIA